MSCMKKRVSPSLPGFRLQVVVVAFKRGQLRVLSTAWDADLGGRDFDEVRHRPYRV